MITVTIISIIQQFQDNADNDKITLIIKMNENTEINNHDHKKSDNKIEHPIKETTTIPKNNNNVHRRSSSPKPINIVFPFIHVGTLTQHKKPCTEKSIKR